MTDTVNRFEQLLEELAAKGLNQADVAQKLDLAPQVVSDIKRGRRPVSYPLAQKVHEVFGVNPDWLLRGAGEVYVRQDERPDLPRIQVPMVLLPMHERVSAGIPPTDRLWPLSMHPVPEHQAIPDAGGARYVLRVPDDELAPLLLPGDLVLVENVPAVLPEMLDGKLCALELAGGRRVLRQAYRIADRKPPHVELRSPRAGAEPIRIAEDEPGKARILGLVRSLIWRVY